MTPAELANYLDGLIRHDIKLSTMIWGPPGIGKSSIVAQTAEAFEMACIDLRLSQLAPTDLRGLPVAENGLSRWYPPEFLPREGKGILFLDELNLAPPAMQGMAQQLILDRQVGSYRVPEGWFIWAAGNRKEDMASVYDMPSPLANRFLHLEVEPEFESFKRYALDTGVHENIIAFLAFRTNLLHKLTPQQNAWPSPRSWVMASKLHRANLSVESAVGSATAQEFKAFVALYGSVPDLEAILRGEGKTIPFPSEPSLCYATIIGLTSRAKDAQSAYHAFQWLVGAAKPEWVQLCAIDLFRMMRIKGMMEELNGLFLQDEQVQQFLTTYQDAMAL
ncbi:MAG TPA: MoxR family ATPase [Anaerolineales bacterium]|nr:MoxR family ATPase [Anaerolineales bacterium]